MSADPAPLPGARAAVPPCDGGWRRFRQDRAAVAGLAVVAAMGLLCLLAPWIAPDPEELRPWLGARPPLSRDPAVPLLTRLAPGLPGPGGRQATYLLAADDDRYYRCVLRRGVLELRGPDARPVAELVLGADAVVVGPRGPEGPSGAGVLVAGGAPPPWLTPEAPVRYVRVPDPRPPRQLIVEQDAAGRIVALRLDGVAIHDEFEVRGERVLAFAVDGRPRTALHLLGTDMQGRDLWARTLHGGRLSLSVGLVATAVALLIGSLYGAIAGFRGGRSDALMVAGIDVLDAIPFLFLVILLMTIADRSLLVFFAALGCVQWLTTARIVRAQVLGLAASEFALAARALGLPGHRIVLRHLLPNCMGPVLVFAALTVPAVILEESFLAFIGLGVQHEGRPLDSWGSLIHQGMQALGSGGERAWLLLVPAAAMTGTLLALNLVGDGLRATLDPRLARMAR